MVYLYYNDRTSPYFHECKFTNIFHTPQVSQNLFPLPFEILSCQQFSWQVLFPIHKFQQDEAIFLY